MATRTQTSTQYSDDIEDKPFAEGEGETLTFSFAGKSYEIDLNTKNADKMRKAFGFYVDHARPVSGREVTTTRRRANASSSRSTGGRDYDLADLRAWAGREGIELPSRGRIKSAIIEQYKTSAR